MIALWEEGILYFQKFSTLHVSENLNIFHYPYDLSNINSKVIFLQVISFLREL